MAYLVALDALVATLAAFSAVLLRFGDSAQVVGGVRYVTLAVLLPPVWLVTMMFGGAYDPRNLVIGAEECRRVCNAGIWLLAGVSFASYAAHVDVSRGLVAIAVPLVTLLTLVERYGVRKVLHRRLSNGAALHHVVVVGSPDEVRDLIRYLRRARYTGYSVVGACVSGGTRTRLIDLPGGAVPVLAPVTGVAWAVRSVGANTIALAGTSALSSGGLRRLAWELEGTDVEIIVAPSITDIAGPRVRVRPVYGLPLLQIEQPEFRGWRRLLKEAIDRAGAALLVVILSPLLLGTALVIRLTTSGPILFRQVRIGRQGQPFSLWKFRSMYTGADKQLAEVAHLNNHDGPLFKIRRDPRVTRVGRWLRRCSLDELPQLWNVLTGSMSLVGPRPPLPDEAEGYGDDARRRLLVKPGLTGLWQVSGRAELSWEECVRLDLFYVENWSVALDAMIIGKTLGAVLRGTGAY